MAVIKRFVPYTSSDPLSQRGYGFVEREMVASRIIIAHAQDMRKNCFPNNKTTYYFTLISGEITAKKSNTHRRGAGTVRTGTGLSACRRALARPVIAG
jgi:hypothetical protein